MSLAQPADVLTMLSPIDREIAELKALVGERLTKAEFLGVVRAAGLVAADGKSWSNAKLNESIDRLVRKRVLSADGAIAPDWREPLTLSVVGREDRAALLAAVRRAQELARGGPQLSLEHGLAGDGRRSGAGRALDGVGER